MATTTEVHQPKSSVFGSACDTCQLNLSRLGIDVQKWDYVVALAGNPNTGKSTVFNKLTGLKQHTGNWPGKTVSRAEGGFSQAGKTYKLIDLPGTYSLLSASVDEEIARDFLLFGQPDCTIVVVDATVLERNLNLVLQILEITGKVVVCLNLMDEAKRRGIEVDHRKLAKELGVPVVPTVAQTGDGLHLLVQAVSEVVNGRIRTNPRRATVNPQLQAALDQLTPLIEAQFPELPNARWVAMRLLDGDIRVQQAIERNEWQIFLEENGNENGREEGTSVSKNDPSGSGRSLLQTASQIRSRLSRNFRDMVVIDLYNNAEMIADRVIRTDSHKKYDLDQKIDRWVTSPVWGLPLMFLLLAGIFWLTIAGANVPSSMLASGLFWVEDQLAGLMNILGSPWWLTGFVAHGVFRGLAWVVSVMLPPMAIFFPLFTILEDLGYLPRVAFNLDWLFKKAGAHGKQALTMSMGFGCNAAGVISTRIIESPRERLLAIVTNNFVPCNGRFPTLIMLAVIFMAASFPPVVASLIAAGTVTGVVLIGIAFTFGVSWMLSRTLLKGEASSFTLELPPYRKPNVGQILYTSLIDRTIFVLWRAIIMAAPAGGIIWLLGNITVGGVSLTQHIAGFLQPLGHLMGLDGIILLSYIVAIPANEIVVPTILMGYANAGMMFQLEEMSQLRALLVDHAGWTILTAVNLMLFALLHNPCSTTILTIWKETKSAKWTAIGALLPLGIGVVVTVLVATLVRLFS
ncbi:MAG: ferrous iron transport protein B [Gemmatimonadetes bacterium]|nr:MAG: ferrous iron transport protein B [Gemmatimonadota bacterium]